MQRSWDMYIEYRNIFNSIENELVMLTKIFINSITLK